MNELKQIRTMAELILEKVSALEGVRPQVKVEPKFKVGDRVKSIYGPSCGAKGTVSEVRGNLYYVKFDHGVYHHGYNNEAELILIEPEEREWHSGPPPHVGWWNASNTEHPDTWRWWDGEKWSAPAFNDYSAKQAGVQANTEHDLGLGKTIVWSDYYPENARVPRVNPGV